MKTVGLWSQAIFKYLQDLIQNVTKVPACLYSVEIKSSLFYYYWVRKSLYLLIEISRIDLEDANGMLFSPGQDHLFLIRQFPKIIEGAERLTRGKLEWFSSKVELTLLERHETCSSKETWPETREIIIYWAADRIFCRCTRWWCWMDEMQCPC